MNECLRCGKCCQSLGMRMQGLSPEIIDYLVKRGCSIDDGFVLIPHRCQHLRLDTKLSVFDIDLNTGERKLVIPKYLCDIHYKEDYPVICRRFHGHGRYYIPEGCVYLDQKEDTTKESKSLIRNIKSVRDHEKGSV